VIDVGLIASCRGVRGFSNSRRLSRKLRPRVGPQAYRTHRGRRDHSDWLWPYDDQGPRHGAACMLMIAKVLDGSFNIRGRGSLEQAGTTSP